MELTEIPLDSLKSLITRCIENKYVSIPNNINGDTLTAKIDNYSRTIVKNIRHTFPTKFLSLELKNFKKTINPKLVHKLFVNNPKYVIGSDQSSINWSDFSQDEKNTVLDSLQKIEEEQNLYDGFNFKKLLDNNEIQTDAENLDLEIKNEFHNDIVKFIDSNIDTIDLKQIQY